MMLGVSGLIATSAADNHESGGASGGSSEVGASSSALAGGVDESERVGQGGGGNRWPRQETLALLKIRSDMDVTFRDASLKGPLWEEVSRKLAELGFQRSAKKCKEKFENVFKYHKRTKDGRASKQDAKAYRFFDQLEALENTSPNNHHFSPPPPPRLQPPPSVAMVSTAATPMPSHVTVPSASPTPLSVVPPKNIATVHPITSSPFQQSHQHQPQHQPQPQQQLPPYPHPLSNSTSSSTSSDEDIQRRRGRKRKWKEYFEKLMTDVVQKQEELQKKFLEALERRERDRITREEAWRVQETARMNREHDILVQERSLAAAKDSAVISFLQKVTGQTNLQIPTTNNIIAPPQPSMPPPPQQTSLPPPPELQSTPTKTLDITPHRDNGGGGDDHISPSSSRWPKAEVEALIKLRKDLEVKYQENGPKGPLWEEISKAMSNIGYNRSSKRCKEKWENINKYFKKVKESNKKRPQDSKTCPYFHQLDAIYKERAKNHVPSFNLGPIMARPEQQWPQQQQQSMHQDNESENHEGGGEEEDDNDDDDDDDVGDYEMIATKQPSSVTNTVEGG